MEKSLIECLIEAGYPRSEMYHHYSDLYIYVTPLTKKVVKDWYNKKGYRLSHNVVIFKDNITGKLMYDCAFQYYEE